MQKVAAGKAVERATMIFASISQSPRPLNQVAMSFVGQIARLMTERKLFRKTQPTKQAAAVFRLRTCHIRGGKLSMQISEARKPRANPEGIIVAASLW